jgi:hypothetical protein
MHNFASSFDADRFLGKTDQVIIHHNIGAQLMLLDVQDLGLHAYYIGLLITFGVTLNKFTGGTTSNQYHKTQPFTTLKCL